MIRPKERPSNKDKLSVYRYLKVLKHGFIAFPQNTGTSSVLSRTSMTTFRCKICVNYIGLLNRLPSRIRKIIPAAFSMFCRRNGIAGFPANTGTGRRYSYTYQSAIEDSQNMYFTWKTQVADQDPLHFYWFVVLFYCTKSATGETTICFKGVVSREFSISKSRKFRNRPDPDLIPSN
jgi:hypothetical protein